MPPRAILFAGVLALALAPADGGAAQSAPDLHHQSGVAGPIVESPEAIQVTSVIQCYCGGCVNQTLHECTCALAAAQRAKVAEALAAGATPETLIARYVAEHGPQVRIVPEKRGLNLIGWAVPFAATLAGLGALTLVLLTWRRRTAAEPLSGEALPPAESDTLYRERLERDLRRADRC
ncbi:MAG TPA: cytochrome c-type biogenesis protein CcmH [Candidatus Polarisedimenticolia bacterium]|nr:cytochrome c-type biogenesis protein CcmH [Candidatus Polarisedimenticolia bacterium]